MTATSAATATRTSAVSAPFTESLTAQKATRWLPWLTGALTLVAALHAIEPLPIGIFYDDAQYLVLAKALATGNGYRFLNLPGAPLATHFPPGYPTFLALLWRVAPSFPENVALFKLVNALLLAMVAVFTCELARRTMALPRLVGSVAALAGAATIPSLVLSSAIMSEPLFLAMLLPLLIWSEQLTQASDGPAKLSSPVMLGVATGVLALVRTHGVALVAAVIVAYLLRRRRREAAACAAAAGAVLGPWMLWVRLHNDALPVLVRGAYGSYTAWLAAGWRIWGWHLLAVTLPDNIATLWMSIVRSIVPSIHPLLDLVVGCAYFALAAVGSMWCWRRAKVTVLFVACYLAIVLVWPFSPLRFVWGIWPLLMVLPAAGIVSAWRSPFVMQRVAGRVALGGATVLLTLGIAAFTVRGYANSWWSANARFHARRVLPQLAWVARSTAPNDVVAADAEAAVYLYTGRRAVPITTFTAAEYVRERTVPEEMQVVSSLLNEYRPRYVLVTSPQLAQAAAGVARAHPASLVRVDSLGQGAVYAWFDCTPASGKPSPGRCERSNALDSQEQPRRPAPR